MRAKYLEILLLLMLSATGIAAASEGEQHLIDPHLQAREHKILGDKYSMSDNGESRSLAKEHYLKAIEFYLEVHNADPSNKEALAAALTLTEELGDLPSLPLPSPDQIELDILLPLPEPSTSERRRSFTVRKCPNADFEEGMSYYTAADALLVKHETPFSSSVKPIVKEKEKVIAKKNLAIAANHATKAIGKFLDAHDHGHEKALIEAQRAYALLKNALETLPGKLFPGPVNMIDANTMKLRGEIIKRQIALEQTHLTEFLALTDVPTPNEITCTRTAYKNLRRIIESHAIKDTTLEALLKQTAEKMRSLEIPSAASL